MFQISKICTCNIISDKACMRCRLRQSMCIHNLLLTVSMSVVWRNIQQRISFDSNVVFFPTQHEWMLKLFTDGFCSNLQGFFLFPSVIKLGTLGSRAPKFGHKNYFVGKTFVTNFGTWQVQNRGKFPGVSQVRISPRNIVLSEDLHVPHWGGFNVVFVKLLWPLVLHCLNALMNTE